MKKIKKMKNRAFWITIFIDVFLVVAVVFLMNHVQRLLDADVKINLTEIVTQNKDVIASKLMLEVGNLDFAAKQVAERFSQAGALDEEAMKSIFLTYAKEKGDSRLVWASADGRAVLANGKEVDVSGRRYFKLAMQGVQNISERTISRVTGEDMFVIATPLKFQGQVIGSIQKQYTPKEIYDICVVSLFSKQGYVYIINKDGYILLSSQPDLYSRESDNFYRMLYLDEPDTARQLEADIRNNQAGFMETEIGGEKVFSAYMHIDKIYDWYLISSVANKAVSPNASIVIRLFYCILLAAILALASSMYYYLSLKKKQQKGLERIAFVDGVTQGSTYTKFMVDMKEILSAWPEKKFYIVAFDIDNFKFINSSYGFEVGDQILHHINSFYRIKLSENELISRVTSDHFVMFLEDVSEKRLADLFRADFCVHDIQIYISAGVYPIGDREESINLMVDKAKLAAQKIKGIRYQRIEIYAEELDKAMMRDEQLKRSVESALAEGEIVPFFQPKIDIHTQSLVGAEALARWKTKEGKLVSPGEFIPVCEKTGLIVFVDMAIFEQTLQFIRAQLDKGIACAPISVNFSRMHLLNDHFVPTLLEKLCKYQVPPELIELELTETVIFENYQVIVHFIQQLHENGLQIAIDDFGSGYSSLHMLKDVDIDVLKIDRGFLSGAVDSEKQKIIFGTIVRMARDLRIKVVVEGVENMDNINLMKEFGCSIAQGYFYAKPMEQNDFEKLYEEGKIS